MSNNTEEDKKILESFIRVQKAIKELDLRDIRKQVQDYYEYMGNYLSWRIEAEDAIERLELMASLGDEKAFRALSCLAHEIINILNKFAKDAKNCKVEKEEDNTCESNTAYANESNTDLCDIVRDLDFLADLPVEKLDEIMTGLNEKKADSVPFHTRDLIKASMVANGLEVPDISTTRWGEDECEPDTEKSENILELVINKLVGMRTNKEAVSMIRKEMNLAERWPVSLSSVKELSDSELRSYYSLDIGRDLPLERNFEMKRGKARTLDAETPTGLALYVFENLEISRCYPYADSHLCEIRTAHERTAVAELLALKDVKTIDNWQKWPNWHQDNWWEVMAALLPPFSSEAIVIQKWTDAGVWYCRHIWNQLENVELLPEFLRKKACHSTDNPSSKAIRTAVSNALKDGLRSLARKANQ